MSLLYLPVELLLHVGSYLSHEDQISVVTTCKDIRRVFMVLVFGGTVKIRSPLPPFPGVHQIFDYVHQGMPGLQECINQVAFYRQHSDLARYVHTVQITNWIPPCPQGFGLMYNRLAETEPVLNQSYQYYFNALWRLCCAYDYIVVHLVYSLPFSELQLIRTHITANMHHTLQTMPTLRRLTLEDCVFGEFHVSTVHTCQFESFKVTSGEGNYLTWHNLSSKALFIHVYIFWGCSTLTKLEICIEFLRDDALEVLSFPSLTSLAIVPHANTVSRMWSWRTVYLVLKNSPNITCFIFEPLHPRSVKVLYPFAETSNWNEYKRSIHNLPLSQLSSVTAYRQLVKRLVPGRPVSFVKIFLFPEAENRGINWPEAESDDEVNDKICRFKRTFIVPYQLARSATWIKTLYLQRIDEEEELETGIWAESIEFLRDACPYVTDLWIPSLKITSRRRHYRNPVDMEEILDELIWKEMTLERCAIGSCSPWMAKELEWHREGTILPERMHPTLEELLLGVDVLWKWQDDSEARGWVLYISADIEGSEDSEEAVYITSEYAESVSSYRDSEDERSVVYSSEENAVEIE